MINPRILNEMRRGALDALLWQANDEDGRPLDNNYSTDDIDSTDADAYGEAVESLALAMPDDTLTMLAHYATTSRGEEWSPGSLYGHDFALTSNGHGVGFWDRGEHSGAADRLTEACRAASYDLYEGDDGTLCIS